MGTWGPPKIISHFKEVIQLHGFHSSQVKTSKNPFGLDSSSIPQQRVSLGPQITPCDKDKNWEMQNCHTNLIP